MLEDVGTSFAPGERITHREYGQGVVLDAAHDGYLRAFFRVGERRVPPAIRRELSRTERILRAADGGSERARKVWLSSIPHLTLHSNPSMRLDKMMTINFSIPQLFARQTTRPNRRDGGFLHDIP